MGLARTFCNIFQKTKMCYYHGDGTWVSYANFESTQQLFFMLRKIYLIIWHMEQLLMLKHTVKPSVDLGGQYKAKTKTACCPSMFDPTQQR